MKKLHFLLLAATLAAAAPVTAQLASEGVLLDRVVAVVNDGIVLQSELDRKMTVFRRGLSAQGVTLPPEDVLRNQVLESLVMERIQLQRAERLGLEVSDEEVNRSLAALAQQNGVALSDLPAALAREGLDYGRYREDLRKEMVLEQLRIRDVASRISITRAEVEKIVADTTPSNLEFEVQHILIATGSDATEEEIEEAREKAEELYRRLDDGADFGPLAIAYSNAPGVLTSRGNLGYLKADALPSIFADEVRRMSPGEVAPPVESPSGFHIVRLNDIRGVDKVVTRERLARHILVVPNEVVSEDEARDKLADIREQVLAGADFAGFAQEVSEDPGTASEGGELSWSPRGTFVPEFEMQLDSMDKGELSQPFRTEFGWHLVQLLDTRERDSTFDARMNQAAQALRARKFEEEAQDWLRQLRDEAYVEIRLGNSS